MPKDLQPTNLQSPLTSSYTREEQSYIISLEDEKHVAPSSHSLNAPTQVLPYKSKPSPDVEPDMDALVDISQEGRAFLYHYLTQDSQDSWPYRQVKRSFHLPNEDLYSTTYKAPFASLDAFSYFANTKFLYGPYVLERTIARAVIWLEFHAKMFQESFLIYYEESEAKNPLSCLCRTLALAVYNFLYLVKWMTYDHLTLQWLRIFLKKKELRFLQGGVNDHVEGVMSFLATVFYGLLWIHDTSATSAWLSSICYLPLTVITFFPWALLLLDPRKSIIPALPFVSKIPITGMETVLIGLFIASVYFLQNLSVRAQAAYQEYCPHIFGLNATTDAYASTNYDSVGNTFREQSCFFAMKAALGPDYALSGMYGASPLTYNLIQAVLIIGAAFFIANFCKKAHDAYWNKPSESVEAELELRTEARRYLQQKPQNVLSVNACIEPNYSRALWPLACFILGGCLLYVGALGLIIQKAILYTVEMLYTVEFAKNEKSETGSYTIVTSDALKNKECFAWLECFMVEHPSIPYTLIGVAALLLLTNVHYFIPTQHSWISDKLKFGVPELQAASRKLRALTAKEVVNSDAVEYLLSEKSDASVVDINLGAPRPSPLLS